MTGLVDDLDSEPFDIGSIRDLEDSDPVTLTAGELRALHEAAFAEAVPLGSFIDVEARASEIAAERMEVHARGKSAPPSALDAERAVIGCALLERQAIDDALDIGLVPEDFYRPAHAALWGAIAKLHGEGEPVDVLHVCDELMRKDRLDFVGGSSAVSALEALLPSAANAAGFARMVREKAALRILTDACVKTQAGIAAGRMRPADAIDEIQRGVAVADRRQASGVVDLGKASAELRSSSPAFGGRRRVSMSGFSDLDDFGFLQPEGLTIVGARPSMGKTQFVLDIVKNIAVKRMERFLFFSLEMPAWQCLGRIVGSATRISLDRTNVSRDEYGRLEIQLHEVVERGILKIDDQPGLSIGQVRARAKAEHRRGALAGVAVDYVQLMGGGEDRGDDREAERRVAQASKGLKELARNLKIPVIALSQLNRSVESRNDKRPQMSDLRESGGLEQDADVIAFLYREEYYAKEKCPDAMKNIAEVIIAKNRNGPTGLRKLHWNASPPCFSPLEHHS